MFGVTRTKLGGGEGRSLLEKCPPRQRKEKTAREEVDSAQKLLRKYCLKWVRRKKEMVGRKEENVFREKIRDSGR